MWFFLLSPVFLTAAYFLIRKYSPNAFGSGIPQVIVSIEKKYQHLAGDFLSIGTIWGKISSSLLGILSGAAIGREGPSLQISAAIALNAGKFIEKIGIKVKQEQLIIAGAASGLAAAFNTPIGGIVYAVEELTHDHIRSYKTVLLLSVMISGFTAQLLLGNYLYLGYPKIISYLSMETVVIVSVVSFFAGILGACFSKALIFLIDWRKSKEFRVQLAIVAGIGLILAALFFFFGPKAIFSGKDSINDVLFNSNEVRPIDFIFRFFSPLLSSMTGIAGGIFAPSLSAGATFGGMIAHLFDPSLRTILGLASMIGFLTGVTRTPITSFVLVLEMTDRHSSVFPMMLAAVFSSLGSRILGEQSFYEESVEQIKSNLETAAI